MANSLMRFTQNQNSNFANMPMNARTPQQLAQQGGMNMPQMLQQIRRFSGAFRGDAKQQVMSMVQQGLRSNEQLQQAMQMAQQLQNFF